MFITINNILSAANLIGFFLCLRYANGMHWKASIATVIAITHIYDGCSAYPITSASGEMNVNTNATNTIAVNPTAVNIVEYTFCGSSPSLLEYLKKVVSIPNVSSTNMRAV